MKHAGRLRRIVIVGHAQVAHASGFHGTLGIGSANGKRHVAAQSADKSLHSAHMVAMAVSGDHQIHRDVTQVLGDGRTGSAGIHHQPVAVGNECVAVGLDGSHGKGPDLHMGVGRIGDF